MAYPHLEHRTTSIRETDADAIVLALPPLGEDALEDWPGLSAALEAIGFTGKPGSTQRVHVPEATSLPVTVVGTGASPTESAIRDALGAALRTLTNFDTVAIATPRSPEFWRVAAEGALLGGYQFDTYKSDTPKPRASRVLIHTSADLENQVTIEEIAEIEASAAAVALVKDLVNIPAEWLSPADFADRAEAAVRDLPVTVTVYDEDALREGGFGGILGVGQGSDRAPRMVHLEYAPANAKTHIALVGKGITFDTGGLSLKPPTSMVGMKYDMCGAATALAVTQAVAAIGAPVKVTAWLCLTDNMPSGRAIRPGDVLRTLDGTTVEVLNTDAEGRLVLADGLAAASREKPDVIIDVATLTGAISVALGTRHVGVMGDEGVAQRYLSAARAAGELAWQLPLPDHMLSDLDSPIADLQNAKIGDSAGGSLFAGLFLRHFVGRTGDEADAPRIPWIHLDIAGVGNHKGAPYGFTDKGPTGATVRSLVRFLTAEEHS